MRPKLSIPTCPKICNLCWRVFNPNHQIFPQVCVHGNSPTHPLKNGPESTTSFQLLLRSDPGSRLDGSLIGTFPRSSTQLAVAAAVHCNPAQSLQTIRIRLIGSWWSSILITFRIRFSPIL